MSPEKRVVIALVGISVAEGIPMAMSYSGWRRLPWLEVGGSPSPVSWVAAAAAAALFIAATLRSNALIRARFFDLNALKALAILMAVISGIFEEAFFRGYVMDVLRHIGYGGLAQVVSSALIFGALHGIWAVGAGSIRAGVGATIATAILGALLAVVYLLAGRNVLPCMAAHVVINVALEPWLLLSAFRGEWNRAVPQETQA